MGVKTDSLTTGILVTCAVVITALVVRKEFFVSPSASAVIVQKPTFVEGWRSDLENGVRLGSREAAVQIIEFGDFECPFCGSFRVTLKNIEAKHPNQIGLSYVQFPIPGHRFAIAAARAAECASDQGFFEQIYDQLYEGQDQFGLKPWVEFGKAAGVPDLAAFDACIKKANPVRGVQEGKALGDKLDVRYTPTVIINGWKLGKPPSESELDEMVQRILAGKSPIGST
jgi:protein-disulfide isomerase